jgi:ferredoxin
MTAGRIRIVVDEDRCVGTGICESIAEDVFEVQDDGTMRLLTDEVDESDRARIEQAVARCPTAALQVTRTYTVGDTIT